MSFSLFFSNILHFLLNPECYSQYNFITLFVSIANMRSAWEKHSHQMDNWEENITPTWKEGFREKIPLFLLFLNILPLQWWFWWEFFIKTLNYNQGLFHFNDVIYKWALTSLMEMSSLKILKLWSCLKFRLDISSSCSTVVS